MIGLHRRGRSRLNGLLSMQGASVRGTMLSLSVFAAGLILPFLVVCALIGRGWVIAEQEKSASAMAAIADAASSEVLRFLDDHLVILRALGTSPALDHDEFSRFEQQAQELFENEGIGIVLWEPSGRIRVDTFGSSRARHPDFANPAGLTSGQPRVSDLIEQGAGRSPLVFLDLPVLRKGRLRYVISAVLRPVAFNDLLRRIGLSEEQFGTITDRQGRVIGRSATSPMTVGQVVQGFSERTGEKGLWTGIDLHEQAIRIEYRRLPTHGWLVNVGVPQAVFRAPLDRSLWSLALLAAALVLGAVVLTQPMVRRMLTDRRTLEETSQLLRLSQEAAGAGVWDWDTRTDRLTLSSASARMHGFPVEDGTGEAPVVLSLAEWKARVVRQDLPAVWAAVKRNIASGGINAAQFRTIDAAAPGGYRWVQSFGRAVLDEAGGKPVRFVGLHLDITARCEVEEDLRMSKERLRVSEERLALALDSGEDGLFDWDVATGQIWVSARWLTMLGYRDGHALSTIDASMETIHPDDVGAVEARMQAHLSGRAPVFECEYRRMRTDGSHLWVLTRARVVSRGPGGEPLRVVGTMIDVSQRKEAELRVAHMALHDTLTDLPNRNLFRLNLDHALGQALLAPDRYAVLACDLDRFKAINDTFGHPIGDRLLCVVAERIGSILRRRDTIARLGGDEFAVILADIDGEDHAARICERIITAVGEPILLDGSAIDIGVSIGVAFVSDDGVSAEEVFKRADMALYQAKAAGRNTYRLFEAETHARNATRSLLAVDMKDAIRRGDFFLAYQPVIDVTNDTVASFEALMRWRHPERGLISPAEFIPVAEETGLIVALGNWALIEACREALTWPEPVRVAVNISAVQFRGGLEEAVMTALTTTGLPARRLKLEVTESLLVHTPEQAIAVLQRLRGLGVRIALDDFGTGYSSLSYLRSFPFDKIKIDRSFIRDMANPDTAAIVRAVVSLGERLGMGIVAEGVETAEQLELVRREGCTEVQGFFYSKPLSADGARAFAWDRRTCVAA